MPSRFVIALPVYNEARFVNDVLDEVSRHGENILVVDDGSTDGTAALLDARDDVCVIHHAENRGYGAALITAFAHAANEGFDIIVTIDCDGQHQPQRIPAFVAACEDVDIVSGSRYLEQFAGDSSPPEARRQINHQITDEVNLRLGFERQGHRLTDAFCGFKAYRVDALTKLNLQEPGYAMPLELWAEAAFAGLRVSELPVPLIYLDDERSFGGALDKAATRLNYYREILNRSIVAAERQHGPLSGEPLSQEGVQ